MENSRGVTVNLTGNPGRYNFFLEMAIPSMILQYLDPRMIFIFRGVGRYIIANNVKTKS